MELAPPAGTPAGGGEDPCAAEGSAAGREPARCPRCGSGDLVSLSLRRPAGGVALGVYCAGAPDPARPRRRRPSCGYALGPAPGDRADATVT